MSRKHPVVAITGSSGAGTSTVTETFQQIFLREGIKASVVHGDAFHRYDRAGMKRARQEVVDAGKPEFSHFGPEANLFEDLEALFRQYGEDGTGKIRDYVHDNEEAAFYRQPPGTFTTWQDLPPDTDVLYYEGLHGAVQTDTVDVARHVDLPTAWYRSSTWNGPEAPITSGYSTGQSRTDSAPDAGCVHCPAVQQHPSISTGRSSNTSTRSSPADQHPTSP